MPLIVDDTLPAAKGGGTACRAEPDHGQFLILCEKLCEAGGVLEVVQVVEVAVAKTVRLYSPSQALICRDMVRRSDGEARRLLASFLRAVT